MAMTTAGWAPTEDHDNSSQDTAAVKQTTGTATMNLQQQEQQQEVANTEIMLVPLLPLSRLAESALPQTPTAVGRAIDPPKENVTSKGDRTAPGRRFKGSRVQRLSGEPEDRIQRCRERNRIHARKTRMRKKEHMQSLQQQADELKKKQLRLKQLINEINEKNTASILVGFATAIAEEDSKSEITSTTVEDPRVEELMRRPPEEIPDSSKVPELPALILPGQHASKKAKAESAALVKKVQEELPTEGFDLELLSKDRSKCTPEELDKIRRERNRMHAKRTRDRKRMFMEEMAEICRKLEEENNVLRNHLVSLDPTWQDDKDDTQDSSLLSAYMSPIAPALPVAIIKAPIAPAVPVANTKASESNKRKAAEVTTAEVSSNPSVAPSKRVKSPPPPPFLTEQESQIQRLLEAACNFERNPKLDNSTSALLAVVSALAEATPARRQPQQQQQKSFSPSAPTAVGC